MARYLTIDSAFNPISFEERMAPIKLYKAEYDTEQDTLDELAKNQSLADLSNSELDRDVYNQYKTWNDSLGKAMDELMSSGRLDMNAVRALRREYLTTLAPAEAKLKKRNELVVQQAKEYSPNTMYDVDYSNVPLDQINDDSAYRTYKLDDIAASTAKDLFSNYVAGTSDTEANEIQSQLDKIDTSGLSDEQVNSIRNAIKEGRLTALVSKQEYDQQEADKEFTRNLQREKLEYDRRVRKITPYLEDKTKNPDYADYLVLNGFAEIDKNTGKLAPVNGVFDPGSLEPAALQPIKMNGKTYQVYQDYIGNLVIKNGSQGILLTKELVSNPLALAKELGVDVYNIHNVNTTFKVNKNGSSTLEAFEGDGTAGKPMTFAKYDDENFDAYRESVEADIKLYASDIFSKDMKDKSLKELMEGDGSVKLQVNVTPVYKKDKMVGAEISYEFVPDRDMKS